MHWVKRTGCPDVPDCDCPSPTADPEYLGQIVATACGGSSSSGGSSESSSPVCDGSCKWIAIEVGSDSSPSDQCTGLCEFQALSDGTVLYWKRGPNDCSNVGGPCNCQYPAFEPEYYLQIVYTSCVGVAGGQCPPRLLCLWTWNAGLSQWMNMDNSCLVDQHASCDSCHEPTDPGTFNGQTAFTECE